MQNNYIKGILLYLLILCCNLLANSQTTKIIGKVLDAETNEVIPFVNVFFKNTTIGTTSGFDGSFSLEIKLAGDSLTASCVGYYPQTLPITKGRFQEIVFKLMTDRVTLQEVVVKPGENPAEIILKKIIKNKEKNNYENIDELKFEAYTKIQFDINNISDKFKERRIIKPFSFVFENMDTSVVNGKPYLPVFLSETVSERYFRRTPRSEKEIIKAVKVSGVENKSITQLLGDMYQKVNIYDNFLVVFEKNFVSPISNSGMAFYKYYLIDSAFIDNFWCYNIMFKPRRKQELTFTGNFWVNDTSFAIKSFEIRMEKGANINFINDMVIAHEFEKIKDHWVIKRDKIIIDFNLIENNKNTTGFFGQRTVSYDKYVLNKKYDDAFYSTPTNIAIDESSYYHDENYWQQARHDSLTKDEKFIYNMVDTLKTIPAFNSYVDIINTIFTGYYVWDNIEIGPYASMYSFNEVEGHRFRLGGRTSNEFSTKLMLYAHLAYGTYDYTYKYNGGFLYMMSKLPRKSFGASVKYDTEQLGQSQNAFREDFFLASLLRRNPFDKLSMVNEYKVFYQHEWLSGFSNTFNFIHRNIYPIGSSEFNFYSQGKQEVRDYITTTEVRLDLRFAYKEKFILGEFERVSLGTKYPELDVQYTYGFKNFLSGDYEYHKLQANLKQWFRVGTMGYSKYVIEAGQIWGTLPYPLLKMHEGNETYVFDEYAFNLMNYYEFASDKYVSLYYTHHFEGLFLNKIPLMRKLKWREIVFGKALAGSLSSKNKEFGGFPNTLYGLTKPYFEVGAGVENIFKVLSVYGIWRLSYPQHENFNRFGLLFTLWVDF